MSLSLSKVQQQFSGQKKVVKRPLTARNKNALKFGPKKLKRAVSKKKRVKKINHKLLKKVDKTNLEKILKGCGKRILKFRE